MSDDTERKPLNGKRLYRQANGSLGVQLFVDSRITEALPNPEDHALPLGWYDWNGNPIPEPWGDETL